MFVVYGFGFLLAVLKRNPEAKPHFERAIQLDPVYAAAHFHLGVLYWLEKDPNHGIPFLQTAVRLAPEVFDYRLKLGLAFFAVSHYDESASELKAATQLQPGNASAWNSLGLSLQQSGAVPEAVEAQYSQARGGGRSFEPPPKHCAVERAAEPVAEHVVGRARELTSLAKSGKGVGGAV